jgi:hypothetical protein
MNLRALLLAIASLTASSHAAIIYSSTQNILIPTTFVGVYIDIDGGGTVAEEGAGWDVNFIFNGEGIGSSPSFHPVTATILLDAPTLNLSAGTSVNSSSTFASTYPGGYSSSSTHVGNSLGQFASSTEGYIGFKFTTNESTGPLFGWMRVVLSNTAATGIVKDWAYENSGSSINVGVVPEPSSFCLFALGTLALVMRRSKKS